MSSPPLRTSISLLVLLLGSCLLFVRLGQHPLWDDEALTALAGEAVWETGDTTVVRGHNIVAHNQDKLLRGLNERATPPLPAYLAAPFVGLAPRSSLAARLPFALLGVGSLVVILLWLRKAGASDKVWVVTAIALLGNVSFFMFSRQCRYYSVAMLCSLLFAYCYVHNDNRRRTPVWAGVASVLLLVSNYCEFFALHIATCCDYFTFERKRHQWSRADWSVFGAIHLIGLPIFLIWNPLMTSKRADFLANSLLDRAYLVWLNLKDVNSCELGVGMLLLAAPLLHRWYRREWLVRGPLFLIIYVMALSAVTPQVLRYDGVLADYGSVRYLCPLIPACIGIGVYVISVLNLSWPVTICLSVLAFWTNCLHGGPLQHSGPWKKPGLHSSIVLWLGELVHPARDPYSAMIRWVQRNVPPTALVITHPRHYAYPLMFHAPHALYAWQLPWPTAPEYQHLDEAHFEGRKLPNYVIIGGAASFAHVSKLFPDLAKERWDVAAVHPADTFRPELYWHTWESLGANLHAGSVLYFCKIPPGSRYVGAPANRSSYLPLPAP